MSCEVLVDCRPVLGPTDCDFVMVVVSSDLSRVV